jgi:hypothetical protein
MNDIVVVELPVSLDSNTKKGISDDLKSRNLIHPKFVGKLIYNINQGGLTSVMQSVKVSRLELVKMFAGEQ